MENLYEELMNVDEDSVRDYIPTDEAPVPSEDGVLAYDLKTSILTMFAEAGFELVDEQPAVTGLHLEFKKRDAIIKVFIEKGK